MGDTLEGVTKGQLRVSHRISLDASSKAGRPIYHRDKAEPLVIGKIASLRVPLTPHSTLFRAGESLELAVAAGRNHSSAFPASQDGKISTGVVTVKLGAEFRSHLILPVIKDGPSLLASNQIQNKYSWIQ